MSSSSGSPDVGGIDRILRRRAGKAPEKSNFAETCNLLSQYLKERGAHGMAGKLEAVSKGKSEVSTAGPATTMNLLPNIVRPDLNVEPSIDFFTKLDSSSISMEDTINKVDLIREPTTTNSETAQMTIFYAGQVLVFNDLPVNKAKEIMILADKQAKSTCPETLPSINKVNFSSTVVIESNVMSTTKQQPQANGSDLPIARRASLHRFFSKRKDRAAAIAPYQIHEPSATDSPPLIKPEESNVFEGQSSKQQIDLNL